MVFHLSFSEPFFACLVIVNVIVSCHWYCKNGRVVRRKFPPFVVVLVLSLFAVPGLCWDRCLICRGCHGCFGVISAGSGAPLVPYAAFRVGVSFVHSLLWRHEFRNSLIRFLCFFIGTIKGLCLVDKQGSFESLGGRSGTRRIRRRRVELSQKSSSKPS